MARNAAFTRVLLTRRPFFFLPTDLLRPSLGVFAAAFVVVGVEGETVTGRDDGAATTAAEEALSSAPPFVPRNALENGGPNARRGVTFSDATALSASVRIAPLPRLSASPTVSPSATDV